MSIYLFASLIPKPEHAAGLEKELQVMIEATRAEPGNLRYDLLREADGKPGFHLYEIYVDADAVQAHRDSPHYVAFRAKIDSWLVGPPDIKVLIGVDVAR
ncbi:antibiotic biosynthesis monooxygenase [Burkholderia sp. WAC0059]|uniref:putative quinol monooxygenase n=1 Tax=Burkholderia sp. WAC0059 TaxID=2066022 RepID=UPI000C7F7262|nr:putative quinol monooxygenase [Burkholderia sp. WAC0059]PLZ04311.1 antibiotic biosynthesis monooxygenase [Burkholderia sp. WAC0059]